VSDAPPDGTCARTPGRRGRILDDLSDATEEHRALVALSLVPGVGPGRLRALLARLGSATAARAAPAAALAAVPGVGPQTARVIAAFDDEGAVDEQFRRAERGAVTFLPFWDDGFPPLLRQIYDPPAFLWIRGTLRAPDERAVAVVGTRRATEYGRRQARDFAYALAERGFTIVSGLAYGVDAAAHRAALEAGGRTLAVLGSGADRIYPSGHAALARDVAAQGALVSEYPLGAAPDAPNFPRRNRLISGLALGTLVVEAYDTGGALITARLALEQNREVFALPSPVHSAAGAGANRLIQEGHAKLVLGVDDILAELNPPGLAAEQRGPAPPPALSAVERQLLDVLGPVPLPIDLLCAKADLDPSTALVYLLELEFKGLVRQLAGKQFSRT
jgi:DNA processing protein